jgi:TonB family protein
VRTKNSKFEIQNSKCGRGLFYSVFFCVLIFCFQFKVFSQMKVAVLAPDENPRSRDFAGKLEKGLSTEFRILDGSMAEAAFASSVKERPFNMTTGEAQNAGAAIGCHYFLLVRADLQRRSAFKREEFYEAFAVVYAESTKTGRLVFWALESFDDDRADGAEKKLSASAAALAGRIAARIKEDARRTEPPALTSIEEVPGPDAPEAKNLRPPLPFRRISPVYTATADYYNVEATVDILVDIGADGEVLNAEIVRWAGYGLDESVEEAVRKMNWRPADRNGKTLAMRVLLRYNFKDIEDEEQ